MHLAAMTSVIQKLLVSYILLADIVCVCVCEREREREGGTGTGRERGPVTRNIMTPVLSTQPCAGT